MKLSKTHCMIIDLSKNLPFSCQAFRSCPDFLLFSLVCCLHLLLCAASGERLETEPTSEWTLGLSRLCPAWETAGLCLAASAVCYSVNMKIAGRHGLYSGQGERERVSTMRRGGRVGADIALALGTGSWAVLMSNIARSEPSQIPKKRLVPGQNTILVIQTSDKQLKIF